MKKVMIVEDHPIVLKGLALLIGADPQLEVVSLASTRAEALNALVDHAPHAALIDLTLGKDSGLDLIKDLRIHAPDLKILVLSMHNERFYADRALAAGAHGYCIKEQPADDILEAIRTIIQGKSWISQKLLPDNADAPQGKLATVLQLSDREFQIFGMTGRGMGTSEVAEALHLSVKTIETHKENIKQKLNCPTSRDLRRYATDWYASQTPGTPWAHGILPHG